jgi:hypothetical protein
MLNEKNEIIKFIKNILEDLDFDLDKKTSITKVLLAQLFDENDNLTTPVEPMTLIRMILSTE